MSEDPYAKIEYRRLIAWPERIRREAPLLKATFEGAKNILELGSGPGEHARFLAEEGFAVTAVDASESMLAAARDADPGGKVKFILGDFRELDDLLSETFDASLCLGNVLPHLTSEEDLSAIARGLRNRLHPGAPFLVQILNYERILAKKERSLPITVRTDDAGGEIVFLRVIEPHDDGTLVFYPTQLSLRADREPPIEVVSSRRVEQRGWRLPDIERIFGAAGFSSFEAFGDFAKAPFVPMESRDLIVIAR